MIYAKLHKYTDLSGNDSQSICSADAQIDDSWVEYDVDNVNKLYLIGDVITIKTAKMLDAERRVKMLEETLKARMNEYPPITDYLDAVVKGDEIQRKKYIDDCLAVKAKYPK